ncbi:DNA repair protein rad10 [Vavraia culicis subsp. floridensis]|uniref:DNA repair protein rad10 n=1 Tax=Vavraia culicis (isolate floridensis) TaxID=948595 RepID=L2GWB7_VAVCU|nr:DNA repair protein rad10 [Vavraia culicis subsp. floridensis]ELA47375.1 DNA repair protein rad10 [Vavraia culicis subsp. floridensis]
MAIKVNSNQRGNNVLDYLNQVKWYYEDGLTTDFEIENFISVLFLSLRFHLCKPEYIIARLNNLKEYRTSILLIYIDMHNYEEHMSEFVQFDCQIFLCFSNDEAAMYLAAIDVNAHRSTEIIKHRYSFDLHERKIEFLAKIPKINKKDAAALLEGKTCLKALFDDPDYKALNNARLSTKKKQSVEEYMEMRFTNNT